MNIHESIQLFVAINLLVIGLSHFFQPKIWEEFFVFLHKKGNVGNIFNSMLALGMGSFILSFHLVWKWPMVLVSLYGLLLVLKGMIFLLFPAVGLKSIGQVEGKSYKFKWVGLVMAALGLLLMQYLMDHGLD